MRIHLLARLLLLTSVCLLIGTIPLRAFSIIEVSPAANSLSATPGTSMHIRFDSMPDPTSLTLSTISVFGRWSGVTKFTVTIDDTGLEVMLTPNTNFFSGEIVTVSLSQAVRSKNGTSISGYSWQFWIKPKAASMQLQELTRISVREPGEGHIQTYGANGADLNDDGYSDYFVPNEISNDCRVFLNDGAGGYDDFEIYPITGGSRPSTNENADFNGDGILDIAVGNSAGDSITVFLGDGIGGFLSIENYQAASGVRGLSISDMDGDGDADIVTANRSGNNLTILHNNGDGTFAERIILDANGIGETASATADANGDGILDLFIGCFTSDEICLLLGDGIGGFIFSAKVNAGGDGPWMIAAGDVNGDGHVDVVSANAQSDNVGVVLGDGSGGLSAATSYAAGQFPIAIDMGDIDGDGDLDLMSSNYSSGNWTYWENTANGIFDNRQSLAAASAGSCATFHDRDNDGDLDMTGIDEEADLIILFENPGTSAITEHGDPEHVVVYPNPAQEAWTIRFSNTRERQLEIFDIQGLRLLTMTTTSTAISIPCLTFPSGVYLLKITAEGEAAYDAAILLK